MLRILSDLTITSRVDIAPKSGATYKQGSWVAADGASLEADGMALGAVPMGCVFNMNETTTTLSKDATEVTYNSDMDSSYGGAGKVTLITGPFRGVTDQFSDAYGTPAAGDPLTVVSGLLCKADAGTQHVVALLEAPLTNFEHRGATFANAWRFKTV